MNITNDNIHVIHLVNIQFATFSVSTCDFSEKKNAGIFLPCYYIHAVEKQQVDKVHETFIYYNIL